jgi:hypothetical protein
MLVLFKDFTTIILNIFKNKANSSFIVCAKINIIFVSFNIDYFWVI